MEDLNNSVLVLGSTGFIGRHLVRKLDQLGFKVYAMARTENGAAGGNVHRVAGSIEDVALLRSLVAKCGHIIHAAGMTTPSVSASLPELETTGNLGALASLLSLAGEFPARQLVYLSSAGAVYGDCSLNVDEGASLRPRSYYGAGKVAAEAFIHACTATTSWRGVVLRPSNIYGPGQIAGKGFAIVPTLLSCAATGKAFNVLGDGSVVRDYCNVADLVDVIAKVLEREEGAAYEVYNVASGETASVLELITACERSTGRRIDVQFLPRRNIDVPHVSLNTDSIRSAYTWVPKVSLANGLDQTWRWLQEPQRCNTTEE